MHRALCTRFKTCTSSNFYCDGSALFSSFILFVVEECVVDLHLIIHKSLIEVPWMFVQGLSHYVSQIGASLWQ